MNGVTCFFEQLFAAGKDVRALGRLQTAAIGPATAACLLEFGLTSDIVPKTYRAESVVEAFDKVKLKGRKILLPRAREARPILPKELKKMGATVDEIPAYETLKATDSADDLVQWAQKHQRQLGALQHISTQSQTMPSTSPDRIIYTWEADFPDGTVALSVDLVVFQLLFGYSSIIEDIIIDDESVLSVYGMGEDSATDDDSIPVLNP